MKKYLLLTLIVAGCFTVSTAFAQDSATIKKLLTQINYGVPSSPAFELLPNKPSEVTHLASGNDLTAHIGNFINGNKLQTGAAVDIRPFSYLVGNLTTYQNKPGRQWLWRSVLSVGTASLDQKSADVYIGAGLRVPLIDKGDLRADPKFTELQERSELVNMNQLPQPDFGETAAHYQARIANMKDIVNLKKLRDSLINEKWNAFRLDIGLAGSQRAASGYLKTDSLFRDRAGFWVATAIPILKIKGKNIGQLTLSGNTAWVKASGDTSENNKSVAGARARFFIDNGFALSGEYARIYSRHGNKDYSEQWGHIAIVAEFKIPIVGGWGALAYGGDSVHRTDAGNKFSFSYAFYTDRLIKR